MSLKHLDTLKQELPKLFDPRDPPQFWDDDLIIVSVDDPESEFEWKDNNDAQVPDNLLESPDFPDVSWRDWEQAEVGYDNPVGAYPNLPSGILDICGGSFAGSLQSHTGSGDVLPPDCLAFYLPFHYFHPDWWGVYLLKEGVDWLAHYLNRNSGGRISLPQAKRAARLFLYFHEAFHHKTECFATRLELTHRKPLYKDAFESYFQSVLGTDECLEEGLANASALIETNKRMSKKVGRKNVINEQIDNALKNYILDSPPGYDQGERIANDFNNIRHIFSEANHKACFPRLSKKDPQIWATTQYMFNGMGNIKSRVNYVIPRNSPLTKRSRFRPMLPPSKLVKKLKELCGLEFDRHGGRHDIYRTKTGKKIQIPRHSRDLGAGLMRKIIRQTGLDLSLDQFLQR